MIDRRSLVLCLFQLLVVALLLTVFLGLARGLELRDGEVANLPFAAAADARPKEVHVSSIELENLACFECHSLAYYRKGEDFSHELHVEEDIVHCHLCHAFQGHLQITTRDAVCEKCH